MQDHKGQTLLDIGGGKYDKGMEYLKHHYNINGVVYDPFNRSEYHNMKVMYVSTGYDVITCCNVLNVINCPYARHDVITKCMDWVKEGGKVYFQIYEGNGSGIGKETSKGYQMNKKTQEYMQEINAVFGGCERKGNIIITRG